MSEAEPGIGVMLLLVRRSRALSGPFPFGSASMVVGGWLQRLFPGGEDDGRPSGLVALVLCCPATAGDPEVDQFQQAPVEMLRGDTLRGVRDAELASISVPVAIVLSDPPNRYHQATTVDRLLSVIPGATATSAFPESPRPEFSPHRAAFVETLISLLVA